MILWLMAASVLLVVFDVAFLAYGIFFAGCGANP